jgi:hypothetical protein
MWKEVTETVAVPVAGHCEIVILQATFWWILPSYALCGDSLDEDFVRGMTSRTGLLQELWA